MARTIQPRRPVGMGTRPKLEIDDPVQLTATENADEQMRSESADPVRDTDADPARDLGDDRAQAGAQEPHAAEDLSERSPDAPAGAETGGELVLASGGVPDQRTGRVTELYQHNRRRTVTGKLPSRRRERTYPFYADLPEDESELLEQAMFLVRRLRVGGRLIGKQDIVGAVLAYMLPGRTADDIVRLVSWWHANRTVTLVDGTELIGEPNQAPDT
jgi:hypothetical protein